MSTPRHASLRAEVRPLLLLAVPVALGELAWMAMGVVDTMMVGRVSAEQLAALGVGRVLFIAVAVFGIGLLLGLDTVVSRSFGAGDLEDCRHSLVQGTWLAALLAIPLTLLYRASLPVLGWLGVEPTVLAEVVGYMNALTWAMPPLLLYTAFRRYLQAVNLVRPVMIALVSANLVNVALNWVLIFGNLGAPAMGVTGAGWATLGALSYLAIFLAAVIVLGRRSTWATLPPVRLLPDPARWHALLRLGLPASLQITLELGVFSLATVLAGRFGAVPLSAHSVTLTAASVTYMVPLGVSSAAAVRVGQELGRGRPDRARAAGWTAIGVSGAFMVGPAVLFAFAPGIVAGFFTTEAGVIAASAVLFRAAAAFQFFDGVAVTTIGALRGAGDTRGPMVLTLLGYWCLALPVGWVLAFRAGMGVLGLWVGFCLALTFVASLTVGLWARRSRRPG